LALLDDSPPDIDACPAGLECDIAELREIVMRQFDTIAKLRDDVDNMRAQSQERNERVERFLALLAGASETVFEAADRLRMTL